MHTEMEQIKVFGKANGTVNAPPSKSMAHRLMICAYLSNGGTVKGVSYSDDINATLNCLSALGAEIRAGCDTITIKQGDVTQTALPCNECGSTLRFMIPICMLYDKGFTLTGSERLFARSLEVYNTLCAEQGIEFKQLKDKVYVKGKLRSGVFSVRGDISSQFISGLLFVLPILSGDSKINITGDLESAPYIDMTINALSQFGVTVKRNHKTIEIKGNQIYKPNTVTVEGDWSNAAFFEALNLVNSDVKVKNLNTASLQGDKIYREYFKLIQKDCPSLDVKDCPDLAPVLMAVGAYNHGVHLINTKRLKIKECDRGVAMATELKKFGIDIKICDNEIFVGHGISEPNDILYGHNDHRIVMALSVLLTKTGGVIDGWRAVNKSMPDFFERLKNLGVNINEVK